MAINKHEKSCYNEKLVCNPSDWEEVLERGLSLDWSPRLQVLLHTLHRRNWFHLPILTVANVMHQLGSIGMKKEMKKSNDTLVNRCPVSLGDLIDPD